MAVVGGAALAGRVTTELTMAATSLPKPVVFLSSSSALSFLPSKLNLKPSFRAGSGRRRGLVSMSVSVGTEATATSDTAFADYKASTAFLFPGQVCLKFWMHNFLDWTWSPTILMRMMHWYRVHKQWEWDPRLTQFRLQLPFMRKLMKFLGKSLTLCIIIA